MAYSEDSNKMIGEAWITDLDSASKPGEVFETIAHFPAPDGEEQAVAHLATLDPDDVARGRYAIDVDNGEA